MLALRPGLSRRELSRAQPQRCWDRGRVAFINTEDDESWQDQQAMFEQALQLPAGTAWTTYNAFNGELPSRADLQHRYDSVLICGSHFNVDETHEWIAKLFDVVRACAALPLMRVVGICFGSQVVAAALGGAVGPNACGGYVYRNELVKVAPVLQSMPSQPAPPSLNLLATHGQCVLELPPDAERLAWSAGSPNEWFVAGTHRNVLGCQGHPEYTLEVLRERIGGALLRSGTLTAMEVEAAEESFARPPDSRAACGLLRSFLGANSPNP